MRLIILSIFSIILSSCSTTSNKEVTFASVDFDNNIFVREVPFISNKRAMGQVLGPMPPEEFETHFSQPVEKKKVIGMILSPGLYKSISYIPMLACLEEIGAEVHYVSGSGFSSIVASLYAYGFTPEQIEWKLYKLVGELSEYEVYSSEWKELLNEFIDKEFKQKKIENSKKALALNSYSFENKNNETLFRGEINSILKANISYQDQNGNLNPLFGSPYDVIKNLKTRVDYIIYVDSLGKELKLNSTNNYIFGLYSKAVGYNLKNEFDVDMLLSIPLEKWPLDESRRFNDFIQIGRDLCSNLKTKLESLSDVEKKE